MQSVKAMIDVVECLVNVLI